MKPADPASPPTVLAPDPRPGERAAASTPAERPRLRDKLPAEGTRDADRILDLFLEWVDEIGFELYPAQEEALLELAAGQHVILKTPTGSGKSLVALGVHFKALCEGRRSFYTSPIKALASEKFFALCNELGPDNVGMLTGDASINPEAPVICCTAEVLSNMALRRGEMLDAPYVVMDEFHYYADPERGVAWQVPLITLPRTRFLLMSATLGNVAFIAERLDEQTAFRAKIVSSDERPVPLDFEYRETPLHETVGDLLDAGKGPLYVVNFTQRECAELAQSLTSMKVATREERDRVLEAIGGTLFTTPYGKELRRFLGFGIGVHHAGLLPRYRLLVEQLSQQGLLKVICGTDTLGVGVNIPIRTVVFTKLCKFDGRTTSILSVRDFKQIAGRAGRKGFDDRGSVVCQAPEHVIENRKLEEKKAAGKKKIVKRKPPERGFVAWDRDTFERLISQPSETLESRFQLSTGMVLNLLQHDAESNDPEVDNFAGIRRVIRRCHERDVIKEQLVSEAATLVRALHRAGLVKMVRDSESAYRWAVPNEELQTDFSLYQTLALFLVESVEALDADAPGYALSVLSRVEAVLENPRAILFKQVDKAKTDLINRLKAEGVEYDERMAKLEQVTWPKPEGEEIYAHFDRFREAHPWIGQDNIRPKSIGREMYESYWSFADFVRHYGLQRSEGLVLRYLSQLYKTLAQSVPERAKTAEVYDLEGYFRTILEHTDTSLLEEWESLLHPELVFEKAGAEQTTREALLNYELFHDPKAFAARVRAELHQLVRALATGDYQAAVDGLRQEPDAPEGPWTTERIEEALAPFLEEYGEIVFTPDARQADKTWIGREGPRRWEVRQVLVDPQGDNLWCLEGKVDLSAGRNVAGSLFELRRIGV